MMKRTRGGHLKIKSKMSSKRLKKNGVSWNAIKRTFGKVLGQKYNNFGTMLRQKDKNFGMNSKMNDMRKKTK